MLNIKRSLLALKGYAKQLVRKNKAAKLAALSPMLPLFLLRSFFAGDKEGSKVKIPSV